jgi:acyl-CoA synthetase (AMP-forming)/AMP-acid ligase II
VNILDECFKKYKDNILLITPQFKEGLSYEHIDHMSSKIAFLLENEISINDKIIVLLGNSIEHMIVNYALLKLKAIPVPINININKEELHYIINDCNPKKVICQKSLIEERNMGVDNDLLLNIPSYTDLLNQNIEGNNLHEYKTVYLNDTNEIILILYTSGSTGKPKGVLMKYNGWLESARIFGNLSFFNSETRVFQIMPLYHATGWFTSLVVPVIFGASVVLIDNFGIDKIAKFWSYVAEYKANYLITVPSILSSLLLLASNRKLNSYFGVKYVNCSSAVLLPELKKDFEERFNVKIIEDYSSTEAGIISITFPSLNNGSVGKLAGISEVKISDEGEILVKNQNVFGGYINKPELTKESFINEWFKTGDIGFIKDDFVYLIGRKDDVINKNGEKISPKEIDNVLSGHKIIKDSYTFPYRNEDLNDEIYSVVVLKNKQLHDNEIIKNDIINYCKKGLSLEKIPTRIFFIDSIPKNSIKKPIKIEIIELIERQSINKDKR